MPILWLYIKYIIYINKFLASQTTFFKKNSHTQVRIEPRLLIAENLYTWVSTTGMFPKGNLASQTIMSTIASGQPKENNHFHFLKLN